MKMTNSFWALCTEAIEAFRQHKHAEAVRLLDSATATLASGGLSGDHISKRWQYVEMLRSHLEGITTPGEATSTAGEDVAAVNVLFVLPDSMDSPYCYSVLNVAKGLVARKVNCAIAVPEAESGPVSSTAFPIRSFADIKERGPGFPDGRNPDIIHAWTAQELVRHFCVEMQQKYSARLVIHIQNNEEYLTEKIVGQTWRQLRAMPWENTEGQQNKHVFHPRHGPIWLNKADGFTLAVDTLRRFNSAGAPAAVLFPPVDENLFYPRPLNTALRDKLGIPRDHTVIVYPGNVRAANQEEVGQLYHAVESLNRQGIPATLIRTGRNRDQRVVAAWPGTYVKDLGWVARKELPDIMAAADVFVQPGAPGAYNDQRVPFKLLEYFAMGRPVILPRANLGLKAVHGRDAYVVDKADADGIVTAIADIRSDQKLCAALTKGAVDFYLKQATADQRRAVPQLYRTVLSSGQEQTGKPLQHPLDGRSDQADMVMPVAAHDEINRLSNKIRTLEIEKSELSERLRSMPAIDPLCLSDPAYTWPVQDKEDFGIIVFGHTRLDALGAVLESLKRQDALKYTEVWLDGFQGNDNLERSIKKTIELVKKYPVKHLHTQSGNYGFRKMLILGLVEMCRKYRDILILEDDCFPTRDAVSEFRKELDLIRNDNGIFSVYGHHFLAESEKETCARFQGWGWATTSEKLMPMLRQLIDCYSMTEDRYLKFVNLTLTPDIRARIDITPPRQPSIVLERFFAWDETLCLLAALNNQTHRPTKTRTIYNCGMGKDSSHFKDREAFFRSPPFNLITPEEVWQYF